MHNILQYKNGFSQLIKWSKLLSVTASTQLMIQVFGFLCGLIILRFLSVEEYAFYTIGNAMLSTMTVLSDGGISSGVLAQGSKVWQDPNKLSVVLHTGLQLRKKFAFISLAVSLPILIYLLNNHNAHWYVMVLITLALIPAFWGALSDSLLEIVPKLHQDIKPLQYNQLKVGLWRLILAGLSLIFVPQAFIALLANGVPRLYGNFQLRKISNQRLSSTNTEESAEVKSEILKTVRRILPTSIYICFSGQVNIWLVSLFGKTSSIAQIGAISRLSMILSVFSVVFATIVIPRFARLPKVKSIVLKHFFSIYGILIAFIIFFVTIVWIFSSQLLWLLGSKYDGLDFALLLSMGGSCVYVVSDMLYKLLSSREIIVNPALSITLNIIATAFGIYFFDMSSLYGVLYLHVVVTGTFFLLNSSFSIYSILKLED